MQDKKAQTVAGLQLTEIIPRFGTPLQLLSDNGPENVNEIMRQTVESLLSLRLIICKVMPRLSGFTVS